MRVVAQPREESMDARRRNGIKWPIPAQGNRARWGGAGVGLVVVAIVVWWKKLLMWLLKWWLSRLCIYCFWNAELPVLDFRCNENLDIKYNDANFEFIALANFFVYTCTKKKKKILPNLFWWVGTLGLNLI